jgi:predicted dehydrogenase
MIRAGIVGLGWWGQMLVDSVQGRSDQIRVVAGQTRTPAKAEAYAKAKGIEMKATFEQLLADRTIDAVILATPHSEHVAQMVKAAAAGKHIYTEKPFALDVESADVALAAVEKAKVTLGISFQRRFHPSMVELRKRVKSGALGTIDYVTAEMSTSSALSMPKGYWRTDPSETPAGAMTGIGVHLVDGMIDLYGEIDEVTCINTRRAAPHADDTTAVLLQHKSGVVGTFTGCFATVPGYRFAVAGSAGNGEICGHFLDRLTITPLPNAKHGTPATYSEVYDHKGFNMLGAALDTFARSVMDKKPFPITPSEIRHGVAVFEAIVKSAAMRQTIKVG